MADIRSCSECSRVSNNKQYNCPPRMADGRHFTDYRPRCMINYNFPDDKPLNSYEYRQYLIHNAEQLMKENQSEAYKRNMCGPCVEPYDIGTMLPEQNMVKCDANTCKLFSNDQNGIGTGRMYTTDPQQNDNRANFLRGKQSEQAFLKQSNNCCATPQDDMNYYPWDGYVTEEAAARLTVPAGGIAMTGGDRI